MMTSAATSAPMGAATTVAGSKQLRSVGAYLVGTLAGWGLAKAVVGAGQSDDTPACGILLREKSSPRSMFHTRRPENKVHVEEEADRPLTSLLSRQTPRYAPLSQGGWDDFLIMAPGSNHACHASVGALGGTLDL